MMIDDVVAALFGTLLFGHAQLFGQIKNIRISTSLQPEPSPKLEFSAALIDIAFHCLYPVTIEE